MLKEVWDGAEIWIEWENHLVGGGNGHHRRVKTERRGGAQDRRMITQIFLKIAMAIKKS